MTETAEKVLEAATRIFINRGFEGATMQEIADEADINKGLLHYYFKSKENLFHLVIKKVAGQIVPKIDILIESDDPIPEKIRKFVEFYIDLLIQNPYLPAFILSEINLKGQLFMREILHEHKINPMKLLLQIDIEVREGRIRPINPFNLLLNTLSMCIFPFIARPIFREVSGLSEEDYLKLMQLRKNEVVEFILKAITP